MENQYTADQVFKSWKGELITMGRTDRYLKDERPRLLEDLAEVFFKWGISLDEALSFKREAMLALTTEEGRKGKGKHKGWKELALSDFEDIINKAYISKSTNSTASLKYVIPHDSLIEEWVVNKYKQPKEDLKDLIETAHWVQSRDFSEFMMDKYKIMVG